MWIIGLALRRPYTLVVLALLIAVLGIASIVTLSIDIFPAINVPAHQALGGGWDPAEARAPR